MKNNKIGCIIQARVLSSRLPGKILLNVFDKPLLLHTIERLKKSKKINKIVVATIKEVMILYLNFVKNNISVFRGILRTCLIDIIVVKV